MKRVRRSVVALAFSTQCAAALAQGAVYESKDKAGPVFSDKPSPGAVVVDVPPPNVVELPKVAPAAPPPPAAAPSYRSLAVVSLADGGTVHTNTGAFDFSARSVPLLRATDRIRVRLDGRLLPASFHSTSLRVAASDWPSATGEAYHTLQLVIVDPVGAVLIESKPLRFYVHRASVAGGNR